MPRELNTTVVVSRAQESEKVKKKRNKTVYSFRYGLGLRTTRQ